jgi:hypothetical protein
MNERRAVIDRAYRRFITKGELMFQFVFQHQFGAAVAAYWIFSAAVSALPEPSPTGNAGYLWLYRFCHTTAGNLSTAFGSRIPGSKGATVLLSVFIIPLLFSTTACAALYTIHPGAINTTDSAYDTLLIGKTTIDEAKAAFQAGELPADTKDALNALVQSYNVVRDSYLTYRGALATNMPADQYFQQLNKNLSDLITAIRDFREVKP